MMSVVCFPEDLLLKAKLCKTGRKQGSAKGKDTPNSCLF